MKSPLVGLQFSLLQIDTYVNEEAKERAAAQIKTFCEKGADRKNKDEARRLRSQTVPYTCQVENLF